MSDIKELDSIKKIIHLPYITISSLPYSLSNKINTSLKRIANMEETNKESTKDEIKYRGIRAMPFVIGIYFYFLRILNLLYTFR